MTLPIELEFQLFKKMLRIRRIEEEIAKRYKNQQMRTPVHLSIGQEAVAVAVGTQLKYSDYAVSTHRAHAHYLAKDGCLKAMIAEIYGKVSGCCRGRGGSMHLIDLSVGFMGSTAIVGNTIPIGVGLGLVCQLENKQAISCIFLGDGAAEEGVFFESLNFSVLKNLPVLFICENNRYSVYSPYAKRQPAERKIHAIAKAMGANIHAVDGYDLFASYSAVTQAIESLRRGEGVQFLEFETYRWLEHCGPSYDNDLGYRQESEFLAWQQRDPITLLKEKFIDKNITVEQHIQNEIMEAFAFAEASPFPEAEEAINGQYKISALSGDGEFQHIPTDFQPKEAMSIG